MRSLSVVYLLPALPLCLLPYWPPYFQILLVPVQEKKHICLSVPALSHLYGTVISSFTIDFPENPTLDPIHFFPKPLPLLTLTPSLQIPQTRNNPCASSPSTTHGQHNQAKPFPSGLRAVSGDTVPGAGGSPADQSGEPE